MGSLLLSCLTLPTIFAFAYLLKYLGRWVNTFEEWSDKIFATWKWFDTIALLNESYGMTAICAFIGMSNLNWDTTGS